MKIVCLERVSWDIGGRPIVRNVDLEIAAGEDIALIGPSGSGKTTLLTLLAGVNSPSSGRLLVSQAASRPGARPIVWQAFELFPHLTVVENVAFGFEPGGHDGRWVDAALAATRIADKRDRLPSQLSGGEQQRTAIARALRPEVSLLLLDEPFANLDPALRRDVSKQIFFREVTTAASIVLCSHDAKEISSYCKRVVCIEAGTLTFDGSIEALQSSPHTRFQAEFFGGFNIVPGVVVSLEPSAAQVRVEGETSSSTIVSARHRAGRGLQLPAVGTEGYLAVPSTAFRYGNGAANVLDGLETIRSSARGEHRSDLLRLRTGDTILVEGPAALLGEIQPRVSWSPEDTILLAA